MRVLILIVAAAAAIAGCRRVDHSPEITAALRHIIEAEPAPALRRAVAVRVWKDVAAFYHARDDKPAWIVDDDASAASHVLEVLRTAPAHGFAAADYGEPEITSRLAALTQASDDATRPRQIAEIDAQLTAALLAFGRDVSLGRNSPVSGRNPARVIPEFAPTLARASDDPEGWLDSMRPPHPEYIALETAMISLLHARDRGGWKPVPKGKFAGGESGASVAALRKRLAAGGHLSAGAASSDAPFSAADELAVKAFQGLHGLKATGAVDGATLAAMNVPIDERIRQIAVNLDRWRAMPDDLGARHLIVNIPSFHLLAREDGKSVLDIRVVVGKLTNKTPVFSSTMSSIVFSPYWNIPDSIVDGETVPAIAKDPAYLARNNIEVLDVSNSSTVSYADVDWDDASQRRRLAFRQKPGPGNALGSVKFLFPNQYDVYIHDTPVDRLFSRVSRALSHGCVRLEQPEALARYVLRGQSEWDDETISEAMNAGVEKHVRLREPIPVHLVYFTAWVDENDGLHFQPDIYGYDSPHR
jgi:murein L,D-transpeptidase YcbB/YkuD